MQADLLSLFLGNAPNGGQKLGIVFNDVEAGGTELIHNALGGLGADALHRAGGQVFEHSLGVVGDGQLKQMDLELAAVLGMVDPFSHEIHFVAQAQIGHDARDGDGLVVAVDDGHAVAVFIVAVDHLLHGAADASKVLARERGIGKAHWCPPFRERIKQAPARAKQTMAMGRSPQSV